MRRTVLALAALSALFAAPARAEPVSIAPSSPWNVDFAPEKCRLARLFGEGENRHLVFFEQYWPSETFGLTVAGPSFKRFGSRQRTELSFSAAQKPMRTEPFKGTIGEYGDGLIYSTISLTEAGEDDRSERNELVTRVPQLDLAAAAASEFVSLRQRGKEIRLLTGPLDAAFAVLNRCSLDLIGDWGLDIEKHRNAQRLARWTNPDAVVRKIVANYPRGALNDGEQGIMRMRVLVSTEGRVEDCIIINATTADRLESPACKAMLEARFEPALDAEGKPMRSYFAESVVYKIN
ncbi:energy transducer TonB [Rhizorhabdus sp.]|uniref:energy transducer TonB n=1 Tax=Rhizorhabdus sp. TaxID=1968843 RepID=UPI00198E8C32|nr:TonB family protein [Rhizorhabdus sp.]MBD3763119.1 TonB family protein [Rhizorhabdus sp.]